MNKRAQSRSAARLAAVQALYQHEMEGTPVAQLIHEFHQHRIGAITPADQGLCLHGRDGQLRPLAARGYDHFGR